jgi:hypothetical protein
MEQNYPKNSGSKSRLSALRARGATLRGPTVFVLVASLALALLAMVILLTKFYSVSDDRALPNNPPPISSPAPTPR